MDLTAAMRLTCRETMMEKNTRWTSSLKTKKLVDPATIRINHNTLARLKKHGRYNEILDDIINRLLDEVEKK